MAEWLRRKTRISQHNSGIFWALPAQVRILLMSPFLFLFFAQICMHAREVHIYITVCMIMTCINIYKLTL
jgi:hypothetical protein